MRKFAIEYKSETSAALQDSHTQQDKVVQTPTWTSEEPLILDAPELTVGASSDGIRITYIDEDYVASTIADGQLVRVLQDVIRPTNGVLSLYYASRRQPSGHPSIFFAPICAPEPRTGFDRRPWAIFALLQKQLILFDSTSCDTVP